jgi:hypothetical protein
MELIRPALKSSFFEVRDMRITVHHLLVLSTEIHVSRCLEAQYLESTMTVVQLACSSFEVSPRRAISSEPACILLCCSCAAVRNGCQWLQVTLSRVCTSKIRYCTSNELERASQNLVSTEPTSRLSLPCTSTLDFVSRLDLTTGAVRFCALVAALRSWSRNIFA